MLISKGRKSVALTSLWSVCVCVCGRSSWGTNGFMLETLPIVENKHLLGNMKSKTANVQEQSAWANRKKKQGTPYVLSSQ